MLDTGAAAADSAAVNPTRSASSRSATVPEWLVNPRPSTATPNRDHKSQAQRSGSEGHPLLNRVNR